MSVYWQRLGIQLDIDGSSLPHVVIRCGLLKRAADGIPTGAWCHPLRNCNIQYGENGYMMICSVMGLTRPLPETTLAMLISPLDAFTGLKSGSKPGGHRSGWYGRCPGIGRREFDEGSWFHLHVHFIPKRHPNAENESQAKKHLKDEFQTFPFAQGGTSGKCPERCALSLKFEA